MIAEIEPDAWDELLERLGCADAYLLREYVESARVLDGGRPVLLHLSETGGDVVFPLLVRDLPGGDGFDVTTPYGYGGPVATGPEPPTVEFWELYGDWCRDNGVVTTFIRFHPLFCNHRPAALEVRVEPMGRTVGWRLQEPDLFAGMHAAHRRACRRAARAGATVSARPAPADLSAFAALYEVTMRRVDAADFYLFGELYWDALAGLGEALVAFEAEEGESCWPRRSASPRRRGSTTTSARPPTAGASSARATCSSTRRQSGPGSAATSASTSAGRRREGRLLFAFKRRFDPGGDLLEFAVGKAVHEPDAYRALTGRDPEDLDGFFPAYREGR